MENKKMTIEEIREELAEMARLFKRAGGDEPIVFDGTYILNFSKYKQFYDLVQKVELFAKSECAEVERVMCPPDQQWSIITISVATLVLTTDTYKDFIAILKLADNMVMHPEAEGELLSIEFEVTGVWRPVVVGESDR